MKNTIAIATAFLAATSFSTAEIVINDFLSFEGFIDMSYTHSDVDENGISTTDSDNSYGIDQVEIVWLFDFDPVTAQIDLAYEGTDSNDDDASSDTVWVEQAFATYHFDNGGAVTAGRFASMLGFEAFEPTGLYQYSFAYNNFDLGNFSFLPLYGQGVKYTHEGDNTFFGISLVDSITDRNEDALGGDGSGNWGVEIAGAYYMDNGLSFFLGGAYEDSDDSSDDDSWLINTYVTFETGEWLFAAELNYGETDDTGSNLGQSGGLFSVDSHYDAISALIMANFAYSDVASVTGRISYAEIEEQSDSDEIEFLKFTLAHSYAFTDNLLLVTEISHAEIEDENGDDADELSAAVELIFSF